MSLFQCENCGCVENTALSNQGAQFTDGYDWSGIEHLKGKYLCSVCGPKFYDSGKRTIFGEWHNRFKRVFLPIGMFQTNSCGNLEHIETGDEDFRKYEILTGHQLPENQGVSND